MAEHSKISWTDHTFNCWMGCTEVSPACDHCYARTLRIRTGHPEEWAGTRTRTSAGYWRNPLKWNRAAEAAGRRALVFCASLADVFEDHPHVDGWRSDLFDLITDTPWLIWQLLTKRPQNVLGMVPAHWLAPLAWPANVWIGTTVEDQQRADERLPHLVRVPAPVRFLSVEPMLSHVDLNHWLVDCTDTSRHGPCSPSGAGSLIQWVICGGESGPGHRAIDPAWANDLRYQCNAAGVPFWFKQGSGAHPGSRIGDRKLDGAQAWPPDRYLAVDGLPSDPEFDVDWDDA